jgi:hypothetical protein
MLGIAIGAGDGESEAGGLVDESQFGEFSAALGIAVGTQALLPFVEGFPLGMHGISSHKKGASLRRRRILPLNCWWLGWSKKKARG